MPDVRGSGLSRAGVIIESVFEDATLKKDLFQEIEPRIRTDALLATNTWSIPLESLASALAQPERLVGLHFFTPVAKMPLVEVITGTSTAPAERDRAMAFTRSIDRLPLPVRSSPGFLVNRILMPYLLEAVQLVEEGMAPSLIDRRATGFGMPVGPVLLADTVGLDICLHAAQSMAEPLGMPIPSLLEQKIREGSTGKKSGQGFYQYRDGKRIAAEAQDPASPGDDIEDRLIMRMINEAVSCLQEGIVEDADLLDAAMVFGAGFAPFRGGLLCHCRTEGAGNMYGRLTELEKKYGERFHPSSGWNAFSQ
jgi:3-hydroxyacyl-CoA dehydrogenase/enoyl-CoA hydratase/3-hydroxybutyryl-CoA epimerase